MADADVVAAETGVSLVSGDEDDDDNDDEDDEFSDTATPVLRLIGMFLSLKARRRCGREFKNASLISI